MAACPTCGKTHPPDATAFCPEHDGTPLTDTARGSAPTTPERPRRRRCPCRRRRRPLPPRASCAAAAAWPRSTAAVDLTLEREVAVKLINPELRNEPEFDARFQREARIASQLGRPAHRRRPRLRHRPDARPVPGDGVPAGPVAARAAAGAGPLPLKAGLQLGGQLLLALIHAHDKGIVHRDIKPDNIFLLNQSGVRLHVRVLDFGIARIYRRDDGRRIAETLTQPGAVLGTPRYMSPEQLAGQPVDARSDLYSAAWVIYEALTGTVPRPAARRCASCARPPRRRCRS